MSIHHQDSTILISRDTPMVIDIRSITLERMAGARLKETKNRLEILGQAFVFGVVVRF